MPDNAKGEFRIEDISPFKLQVYYALEEPANGNRAARAFCLLLIGLIVANIVLIFVNPGATEDDVPVGVFDAVSFCVFAIEYGLRLWTAPLLYVYMTPARARLRYAFSIMGIIDLAAFLPAFLPFLFAFDPRVVKSLRLMRLVRLFKLTRYMEGFESIKRVVLSRLNQIISATAMLVLLILVASVLMYQFESEAQPDVFTSVWVSLYWAVTTITNTGYGDIVPITVGGRVTAFIVMLLSVAFVAIPIGVLSAGFVEETSRVRRHSGITVHAYKRRQYLERYGKLLDATEGDDGPFAAANDLEARLKEENRRIARAAGIPEEGGGGGSSTEDGLDDQEGEPSCCDRAIDDGGGSYRFCPYCGRRLPEDDGGE